jgi:transposase
MAKAKTVVGLDVHATKIVAAVLDVETGELSRFSMSGDAGSAAGFCAGLPRAVWVAYEAGPTGDGLARELVKRGVECVVAAPSKIPRVSGDRVKTDRRDAEHLVRLLLAGKLHPVRVPGPEEEALRDLVRAREQVRVDLMRCRHRLSELLLRHGIRFDDGKAWTDRHRARLARITLPWAVQSTLLDCQGAIDVLCHCRVARSALRESSRLTVDGLRPSHRAIERIDSPPARATAISSRSENVKHRPFRPRPRRGRIRPSAASHRAPFSR